MYRLLLEIRGHLEIVVEGISMLPLVYSGDTVSVIPATVYQVGDIVLYQDGNSLVVHRVSRVLGDFLVVIGDHSRIAAKIPKDAIIGRVAAVSHDGKTFSLRKTPLASYAMAKLSYAGRVRKEGSPTNPGGFVKLTFPLLHLLSSLQKRADG